MSVGDTINALESLAESDALYMSPDPGHAYEVRNLFFSGPVDLYLSDGTNLSLVQSSASGGEWLDLGYELTADLFMYAINPNPDTILCGYNVIVTR